MTKFRYKMTKFNALSLTTLSIRFGHGPVPFDQQSFSRCLFMSDLSKENKKFIECRYNSTDFQSTHLRRCVSMDSGDGSVFVLSSNLRIIFRIVSNPSARFVCWKRVTSFLMTKYPSLVILPRCCNMKLNFNKCKICFKYLVENRILRNIDRASEWNTPTKNSITASPIPYLIDK